MCASTHTMRLDGDNSYRYDENWEDEAITLVVLQLGVYLMSLIVYLRMV